MTRIAAIGNLSLDVVAGAEPRIGGAVYYSADALARTGADARVAAASSATDRDALLGELLTLGLPCRWYESRETTAYSFEYEGDRRIMRQTAVGDPWSPQQALEAVADAGWVHVGALTRTDFPEPTLAALAADGRTLLVDAQGLVRRASIGPLQTDADIGDVLRHVTILKLNDEEAEAVAGSSDPEAVRTLGLPEVILTRGSRGAFLVTPTFVEHVPARDLSQVRDPTGAGDVFSGAYLAARAEGAEPVESARRANDTAGEFLVGK